jgi:3-hydroxyisobutyrate dehydrogenase
MSNAGVIGLGAIGGGVAICLARSGHLKAVYSSPPWRRVPNRSAVR